MKNQQKGFSLVEFIVASAISVSMGILLFVIIRSGQNQMSYHQSHSTLQQMAALVKTQLDNWASENGYASSSLEYDSAYNNLVRGSGEVFDWVHMGVHAGEELRLDSNLIFRQAARDSKWKGWKIQSRQLMESQGTRPGSTPGSAAWLPFKVNGNFIYVTNSLCMLQMNYRTSITFDPGYLKLSPTGTDSIAFPALVLRMKSKSDF
jgi:type II secretory pathway pseudopilin PulG